jgi:N-acyl-D-aspartate/D-glutamate deacylase
MTRDEHLIPLEVAVRKLATLPAENLGVKERGRLQVGNFADLAVFDPGTFQDHATFDNPRDYATGMVHVYDNGVQVLKNGEHWCHARTGGPRTSVEGRRERVEDVQWSRALSCRKRGA